MTDKTAKPTRRPSLAPRARKGEAGARRAAGARAGAQPSVVTEPVESAPAGNPEARTTAVKSSPAVKPVARVKPVRRRSNVKVHTAKFSLGQIVRHRHYPFRGVIFDIDPVFNNTEEWWQSIPEEIRPRKNQPFYHLLAENADTEYVAYVSEQNLLADESGKPLRNPKIAEMFAEDEDGQLTATFLERH